MNSQPSSEPNPVRPRRTLTKLDALVAVTLCVGTIAALSATSVMGYTRDESFYFKFATIYQDWFHRAAQVPTQPDTTSDVPTAPTDDPGGGPMGKRDVLGTWRENFEHPSLMKTLFGWSWREFSAKRRPITRFGALGDAARKPGGAAEVGSLDESDGLEVGDTVDVLAPVPNTYPWARTDFDTPEAPPLPKTLATATVTERREHSATVRLDVADADLGALIEACTEPKADSPRAPPAWLTGCQVITKGPAEVMTEAQAMRLPTWVFFGLLVAILYLFGTELFGRPAGLFAAVAFLFTPHHFFHGHLCTFDMPVTTMIVLTVYLFWRAERSRLFAIITGVVWGLSLVTKLNGYFIPVPLVAAWLAPWVTDHALALVATVRARAFVALLRRQSRTLAVLAGAVVLAAAVAAFAGKPAGFAAALVVLAGARLQVSLPPFPRAFLWMLGLGLPMQFWLWPSMWFDTAHSFSQYVSFHTGHVNYPQEYFGDLLNVPPFPVSYPFVMTWLTVPVPMQLIMCVGLVTLFITHRRTVSVFDRALLFGNALLPIGIIALPSTPIFGGVKHWMATLAFGALIGGFGFDWLCTRALRFFDSKAVRHALTATVLAASVASGAVASVRYVTCGTGYWNELIGGLQGAADHRMMRKFWGFVSAYALDFVNMTAPRNATVAFHETTWDAFDWYQRAGLLRKDLRWRRDPTPNCQPGDLYLFHHQGPMGQDEIQGWERLETAAPVLTWGLDGVPMLSVYQCRKPEPFAPAAEPAQQPPGPGLLDGD